MMMIRLLCLMLLRSLMNWPPGNGSFSIIRKKTSRKIPKKLLVVWNGNVLWPINKLLYAGPIWFLDG